MEAKSFKTHIKEYDNRNRNRMVTQLNNTANPNNEDELNKTNFNFIDSEINPQVLVEKNLKVPED